MDVLLEAHQRSVDVDGEAPPPSYYDSIHDNGKTTSLAYQQEQAPSTNWYVRSSTDPSAWQLLASGPLMSNVTAPYNGTISHKRRYRVLYPQDKYQDVYLHRPPWTSQVTAFPPYHVEVYSGRKRYNPEPIVVLGPPAIEGGYFMTTAKALLALHSPRVVSAVEAQVTAMTRQATFVEMEFFSCDWKCKTVAANHDMRTMILRANEECARSVGLVDGLEAFLAYVSGGDGHDSVSISLRRSCKEVAAKLGRLRL